ncbi:GIY-YIG nuclease family protein [Paraburkholderia saeva]|uniref:GIY-YIG nuclease family protein n=1 Tax=Paraburkholderia saeva TaxID=2777537 RepID=UPI001DF5B349|nr:GIY-YIG nuclease family protein [Paraburkholderia saeva]CAG4926141.1 hypothetical protein R70241_05442 [Paraburkholderia saeva]
MSTNKNARQDGPGATSTSWNEGSSAPRTGTQSQHKPRRWTPQSLHAHVERLIDRELERCRACMSEPDWIEHREWIEEHARACLKQELEKRAARGAL